MHSFMSSHFALKLSIDYTLMEFSLVVTTPPKEIFIAQFEYKFCVVRIRDNDT